MDKCDKCGGNMAKVCQQDHEHGETCEMKCESCGATKPMGNSSEGSSEGSGAPSDQGPAM